MISGGTRLKQSLLLICLRDEEAALDFPLAVAMIDGGTASLAVP